MTTGVRICSYISGLLAIIVAALAIFFVCQFSIFYTSDESFEEFCHHFPLARLIDGSCYVPSPNMWPRIELTEKAALQQVCGLKRRSVHYDKHFVRMAHVTSHEIIDVINTMMNRFNETCNCGHKEETCWKEKCSNQVHLWVGAERILQLDEHSGEFWWFNLYGDAVSRVDTLDDHLEVGGKQRYVVLRGKTLETRKPTTEAKVLCEFRIRNRGTVDEIVNNRYIVTKIPVIMPGIVVLTITCLALSVLFGVYGNSEYEHEATYEYVMKNKKKMKHYKNCVNQLEASGVDVGDMTFKQAGHRTHRRSRRASGLVAETASKRSSRSSRSRSGRSSRRSKSSTRNSIDSSMHA